MATNKHEACKKDDNFFLLLHFSHENYLLKL